MTKDGDVRLRQELLGIFPDSLTEIILNSWTREELIKVVTKCRLHQGTTGKVTENLEGKVSWKEFVSVLTVVQNPSAAVSNPQGVGQPVSADPLSIMAQVLATMQADLRRREEEKEELDRRERREEKERKERERKEDREREERDRKEEKARLERKIKEDRESDRAAVEERLKADKAEAEQRFRLQMEQIKLGQEEAAERHRINRAREDKKDVRVKRASDVLRNTVGVFPSDPIAVPLFFFHLERQFKMNAIDDDLYLPLLNQLLNDKARRLIARLSEDDSSSYVNLKAAIMKEMQLTPIKYRDHVMSIVKRSDESYVQTCTRIEVGMRYYVGSRGIDLGDEPPKLFKLLVADRLKEIIPPELQDFVKTQELKTWIDPHDLASMLDTFVSDRQTLSGRKMNNCQKTFSNRQAPSDYLKSQKTMRCSYCGLVNHTVQNCIKLKTAHNFKSQEGGERGHSSSSDANWRNPRGEHNSNQKAGQKPFMSYSRPDSYSTNKPTDKQVSCFHCKGNHYLRNCPTAPKPFSHARRVTYSDMSNGRNDVRSRSNESLHFDSMTQDNDAQPKYCNRVMFDKEVVDVCPVHNESKPKVMDSAEPIEIKSEIDIAVNVWLADSIVVNGILDTGAQISTIHKDLIPPDLMENAQKGSVNLQGVFGSPVKAELITLPCKLQKTCSTNFSGDCPCTLITWAMTDQMVEKKILLCLPDFVNLKRATEGPGLLTSVDLSGVSNVSLSDISGQTDSDLLSVESVFHPATGGHDMITRSKTNSEASTNLTNSSDDNVTDLGFESSDTRPTNFLDDQLKDSTLANSFKQANSKSKKGPFFIDDKSGLLYKRTIIRGETRNQLCLPLNKRQCVLEYAHDKSGHFASKKVNQLISKNFYWPGMKQDIVQYVNSCVECQKRRRVTVFDRVPIRPVQRPLSCFEEVVIDIVGPIQPTSSRGHSYVIGFICAATRWVEAYPLKTIKTKEILDAIIKFTSYAGIPRVLIHDNAQSFTSELSRELYERLGIEMRTSSPYHPEGHSLIEVWFGTFQKMLHHIIISGKPREWDLSIPSLLFCHRNMCNETTGVSPYLLVFGKQGRTLLDVMYDSWSGDAYQRKLKKSDLEYLCTLKENLAIAQEAALLHTENKQSQYINQYNKHTRDKSFEEGDQVLILMPDSTNKLKSRWNITIKHKSGCLNSVADCFSRYST